MDKLPGPFELTPETPRPPDLSAILVAPYGLLEVETTVDCLCRQSEAHRLELMLVVPMRYFEQPLAGAVGRLHSVKRVVYNGSHGGQAISAGIRAASAPVIVMCEDHSFPQPGWAESLIARSQEGWDVISPLLQNANPGSAVSWANFILNFGQVAFPRTSGPIEPGALPSHQCAYRRVRLLEMGDRMEELIDMGAVAHDHIHRTGGRMYLETGAANLHQNSEFWTAMAVEQFWGCREYAVLRSLDWTPARRLFYTLCGPLIWLVRLRRSAPILFCSQAPRNRQPGILLAMAVGLAAATLGEAAAYLFGMGNTRAHRFSHEFQRHRNLDQP